MRPRTGATLIEVLVASFVMAIGMISLLALFPLGALSMAQAIRDDRAATCASNATAVATAKNLRHDSFGLANGLKSPFENPDQVNFADASADGASYPVYVDPIGFSSYVGGAYQTWVAGRRPGLGLPSISRQNVSFVKNIPAFPAGETRVTQTLRWFSLLDDIDFETNGIPRPGGGFTARNNLYSWAYLLRRPRTSVSAVVEMSVVVYNQRPLALNATALLGSALGGDEVVYNATFAPAYNPQVPPSVVTLSWTAGTLAPALRPGGWILDCTPGPPVVAPGGQGLKFTPGNARFYRVVAVTENSTTSVDVEVETPILATAFSGVPNPPRPPNNVVVPRQFAVLEGVIQVIDKGTSWLP